jgi:thioredoxin reductase (NADPH)
MYDVVIIGRGPAGLSAALYTARSNLKTLVVGRKDSRLAKAEKIDNYFGFAETVSGRKLLEEGEKQVQRVGAELAEDEVISLELGEHIKVVAAKQQYLAKAVLLATGQQQKRINIGDLEKFEGKGVSYCSTCDGFFYNNLKVGVLGYKDFAAHEAVEMLAHTKDITIYTNGNNLDVKEAYKDLDKRFKINYKEVDKVSGSEFLQRIHFKDGTSEEIDGLFVAYDSASSLDFARQLGIVVEGGAVKVDQNQQTNIEGLFAAGDCTGGLKQVSTAVGQGAVAGKAIADYLRGLGEKN